MEYNKEHIDIQYALINAFLIKANQDILDVSYNYNMNEITVQVVMVEGKVFPDELKEKIKEHLNGFILKVNILYISINKFNENIGEWSPKDYKWLEHVLLSKNEIYER